MNADRFVRLKELVLKVADLSAAARSALLDDACRADPELRREIEAILAHDQGTHEILKSDALLHRVLDDLPSAEPQRESSPQMPSSRLAGQTISHYQILDLLGEGGMGQVYRARDKRLGREIALKLLPQRFAQDRNWLARFEREARAVAGLNHPNIVVLHSIEEEAGIRFLTMELIDGQSLDRLIVGDGLPLSRVLELSIQLTGALAAAHEKGVVHRDLKPGNVMVTREGRVKILDFGLAKLTGDKEPADGTMTRIADLNLSGEGQVLGTVPYMAPEQVRGEAVDARADLFAFGIMLYELASGRRPFNGVTSADVCSAILRDSPEPLASGRADLLGEVDQIIGRCLEKNLRDRSVTALDVCNELRRLKQRLDERAVTYDLNVRSQEGYPYLGYEAAMNGVVEAAASRIPCSVLDLGIGTGNLAKRFAELGCEVWGLDFSPRMLARAARKVPGAHLAEADLLGEWPDAFKRRFDLIVSTYAFHHFILEKKIALLCRLSRDYCALGGRIIIADLSFTTTEAFARAREKWREGWDEEYYWIAEEAVLACEAAGLRARYEQVSEIAGVYVITPIVPPEASSTLLDSQ